MIAWKLLQVEWLKIRRRAAFWVSLLFYFGLLTFFFGMTYRAQLRFPNRPPALSLPGAWSGIAQVASLLGGIVVTVAIILLTASEKTWRTERQNVIDGLSRDQYLLGKFFVLLSLPLIVWAGTIALTSAFAVLSRRGNLVDAALIDPVSAKLLGGLLVRLVFLAAIASCFALISAGSGAALAFALLFMFAQQPIVHIFLQRGGFWVDIARYLPDRIMDSLITQSIYDPAQLAAANDGLRAVAERSMLEAGALQLHSPARALTAAGVYIAAFAGVGWLSIRRRDL
jgi:ABC-2 type transport system permease protein